MKSKSLNGKTVVITGASSGVGKATALAVAKEGVNLVLAARRETFLQELASECESLGANAIAVKTDVSDREDVQNLFYKAIQFYDKIDIWFNNAGVGALGDFEETPLDAHEQVIKTNLFGALYDTYFAVPHFKARGEGQIIYMNSTGSYVGAPFAEAYTISKFGLRGLAESLRNELKDFPNIYVSDVFASFIDTTGIQHMANYKGKEITLPSSKLDPYKVADAIVKLAKTPKNSIHIGTSDLMARIGNALSPSLTGYIMEKVEKKVLSDARSVKQTDGNLFDPVYAGKGVKEESLH